MTGKKSCAVFGCFSNSGTCKDYVPVFPFPFIPDPKDEREILKNLKYSKDDPEML